MESESENDGESEIIPDESLTASAGSNFQCSFEDSLLR